MKISNEFAVSTPIDRAWTLLTDLAGIAPCLPGAHLTGVAGDTYSGKVKVKVGPVVSDFAGTARFVEKDDEAHRAVIDAKGRDSRSAGNATALVTAQLRADGDRTLVNVETDLKISGKLAQFGSSMIKEVSAKLLGQFVTNLEAKLAAEQQPTAAETAPAAPAPASAAGETTPPPAPPAPAAASVDLSARNGVAPGALSAGLGAAADLSAGPDAATQPGGGSSGGSGVAAPSGGGSSAGSGADTPSGAGPESSAAPGAGDGGAAAATSPGDWVRGDPHARVAPAVRGSAEPDTAEEPEPLDLLSLAGGTIYKRIIPVGIGAAAVAAAIIWYVARR